MNISKNTLFWVMVVILLTSFFSIAGTTFIQTFYFVTALLPVAVGTSYYFNEYLLPKYLLLEKYWQFALYLVYTIIISLYLEMIILFLSLMVFSYFQIDDTNILTINLLGLSATLYLTVMINAFIHIFKAFTQNQEEIEKLKSEKEANKLERIVVRANRQNHQIILTNLCYIESLGDYVKLITDTEQIVTKEKISSLEKRLPSYFIRIHRSFIVNQLKISFFNKEQVTIKKEKLPISRTYKKRVMEVLAV